MANSVPARADVEGMRREPRVPLELVEACLAGRAAIGNWAAFASQLASDLRDCRAALAAETKRADAAEREREEVAAEMSATLRGEIERAGVIEEAMAEAYQAVSALLHHYGLSDNPDCIRILDVLAYDGKTVDGVDLSPWPKEPLPSEHNALRAALAAETAARIAAEAKVGEMVEALRPLAERLKHPQVYALPRRHPQHEQHWCVHDDVLRRAADLVAQHDAEGKEAGDGVRPPAAEPTP